MGIYATWLSIDGDDEAEDALPVGAPYVYQGSHILPTKDGPRGGWVEIGAIPAFCGADGELVDFLRVSASPNEDGDPLVDLLLERAQVTLLRDTLTLWLDREVEEG